MEKEFVPYEQALELKELGFNKPCFGWYSGKDKNVFYNQDANESIPFVKVPIIISSDSKTRFLAPTFSQGFKWLIEKYNIFPMIQPYFSSDKLTWNIVFMDDFNVDDDSNGEYEEIEVIGNYEEAELACLKKLIEIIKNQKK